MNSGDEIPASPRTPAHKKRRKRRISSAPRGNVKRNKLRVEGDSNDINSTSTDFCADESLSSEKCNANLTVASTPVTSPLPEVVGIGNELSSEGLNVYSMLPDGLAARTKLECENIDIFQSAKLLEIANAKPYQMRRSQSFLDHCSKGAKQLVPFSKLFKNSIDEGKMMPRKVLTRIENAGSTCMAAVKREIGDSTNGIECPTTSRANSDSTVASSVKLKLEDQFFDETESQIVIACNMTDAAQMILRQNATWRTPSVRRLPEPSSQNIVECILNDFECDSPLFILLRENENRHRAYSRFNASSRKSSKVAKVLNFEQTESESGEESDDEGNTAIAAAQPTTPEMNDNVDLDLNSSLNIIENLANLSSYFSQSIIPPEPDAINMRTTIHLLESNDYDFNEISLNLHETFEHADQISFGQLLSEEEYSCDLKSSLNVSTAMADASESTAHEQCEKSLLDGDEDCFMHFDTQQIAPQILSRTKTTSVRQKPENKAIVGSTELIHSDTPIAVQNQFRSVLGTNVQLPEESKNSVQLFADIEKVSAVPTNDAVLDRSLQPRPFALASTGFQTGNGKSISVSENILSRFTDMYKEIVYSEASSHSSVLRSIGNAAESDTINTRNSTNNVSDAEAVIAPHSGEMDQGHVSNILEIQSHLKTKAANALEKENISSKNQPIGFRTGRGIEIPLSDKAIERTAAIFAGIENELMEPARPGKSGNLLHQQDESAMTSGGELIRRCIGQASLTNGFSTARGGSITVSEKAIQKTRNIFENVDIENPEDYAQPSTSSKLVGFSTSHQDGMQRKSAIFGDIGTTPERVLQQPFKSDGFSSASGNKIPISTTALKKYENLFNDMNDELASTTTRPSTDDVFKTPKNSKFLGHMRTSTPISASTPITIANQQKCNTPKTLERLESAEDTLGFLRMLDSEDFHAMFGHDFDQDTKPSERNIEHRLPKKVCLASKFDSVLEDESAAEISFTQEENKCPGIIPDNVQIGRRTALNAQIEMTKAKTNVKPQPGSLNVEKIIAARENLSQFGTPQMSSADELKALGVLESTLNFRPSNFESFEFKMWDYYTADVYLNNVNGIRLMDDITLILNEKSSVGICEITNAFLNCPSVDPNLVSENWIANSLKWIMWKLASMEQRFPSYFAAKALTPANVCQQLKYRYYREIDCAERSAIRRIVERDDVAAKRLVLFVSDVLTDDTSTVSGLELCDGWYAIGASIDDVLRQAIISKKIKIGTKLIIQGAELVGSEVACSPLESRNLVQLKIAANSTRRAKWDTKLGYYEKPWPFLLHLDSLNENGGLICRLRTCVLRVYPIMFMAKREEGEFKKTILRSEKVERNLSKIEDRKRLDRIEALHSQFSEEVDKEYQQKRKRIKSPKRKLRDIDDAEELWEYYEHSNDPEFVEAELSETQHSMLFDYRQKVYEQRLDEISRRVKEKLNAENDQKTKVSRMLKIRVIDAQRPDRKTAIVSIWNPKEHHMEILREGRFIEMRNASASGLRWSELQISAGQRTTFRVISSPLLDRHEQMARVFTPISAIQPMEFQPIFNEFDTVGYVVSVEKEPYLRFQPVHVADAAGNLLCINFFIGVKEYAYDDVVQPGKCIAISQAEWRRTNQMKHSRIPQAYATEYTTFMEKPPSNHLKTPSENLRNAFESIADIGRFVEQCRETVEAAKLSNQASTSTVTPVRTGHNNAATPTPSSLTLNRSRILNTPREFSPGAGHPISLVRQKIEKLGSYPSVSPITPIVLKSSITRRSLRSAFKSPLGNYFNRNINDK